jgi:hypothetical protein
MENRNRLSSVLYISQDEITDDRMMADFIYCIDEYEAGNSKKICLIHLHWSMIIIKEMSFRVE